MKRTKLIQQRLTLGLSQQALASKAGVSTMTVYHVENGKMSYPKLIPKLAHGYDLTPQRFVEILFEEEK